MKNNIYTWAQAWSIPTEAIQQLFKMLNVTEVLQSPTGVVTEKTATRYCQLEAAKCGDVLWRNNVGQVDPTTYDGKSFIRYGLANHSKAMIKMIKSSDLIGIRQITVTKDMVGSIIGQFVAREIKKPGWRYTGNGREEAQLRFLELVLSMGGDAAFSTGEY